MLSWRRPTLVLQDGPQHSLDASVGLRSARPDEDKMLDLRIRLSISIPSSRDCASISTRYLNPYNSDCAHTPATHEGNAGLSRDWNGEDVEQAEETYRHILGSVHTRGEQQTAVPEFVPQVLFSDRGVVRALDELCPCDCFQQQEMRSARWVPSGDEGINGSGRAVGPKDQVGPTMPRIDTAVGIRNRLDRSGDRRSCCNHPAARLVGLVHKPRGGGRDLKPFCLRKFSGLERGNAAVQHYRCQIDAGGDHLGYESAREWTRRTWHLCAPRLACKDRLVVGQWPMTTQVAIADRPAVLAEPGLDRAINVCLRSPQLLPVPVEVSG